MAVSVETRPFADSDRAKWEELWRAHLAFYGCKLPEAVTAQTWLRLLSHEGAHDGLMAVDGEGNILGFAHYLFHRSTWTDGWYCYLEDLYVDETTRGQGAGRALIEAVVEIAKARGAARVHLITQTDNARARLLYDATMTLAPFVQYRVQMT